MTGTPGVVPPCTWGSMRSPLVLNGFLHGAYYTRYSRAWPVTSSPPKFFKWDAGSLFRQVPYTAQNGSGVPFTTPYYWIQSGEFEGTTYSNWGVGIYISPTYTVDNFDFLQLVGEDLVTDIGTFTITSEAHEPGDGQQISTATPGATQITDIGKLNPF